VGKFNDIEQADVPLAPLYAANIVSVQLSPFCQSLLRQIQRKPKLAHALAKENAWVWTGHAPIMET